MNQITLTTIIRDLRDDLGGLHWAVTDNTAYQILTDDDQEVIDIDLIMDLKNYPEAALRLGTETDTFIDSSGVKVFEIEQVYREVPVIIRTTNFEHRIDVFERITYQQYNGIDVPVVPAEYLLATFIREEGRDHEIDRLRNIYDIDADYLRTCVRVLGIASEIIGDQA